MPAICAEQPQEVGKGTERECGGEAGFMDSQGAVPQAEEFLASSKIPSGKMEPFPGGLGAAGGSGEAPDR